MPDVGGEFAAKVDCSAQGFINCGLGDHVPGPPAVDTGRRNGAQQGDAWRHRCD
jgi:hypothetical protein